MADRPRLDPDLVRDFVNESHGNLPRVRELLQSEPALINAAWDWGHGDWETGLVCSRAYGAARYRPPPAGEWSAD